MDNAPVVQVLGARVSDRGITVVGRVAGSAASRFRRWSLSAARDRSLAPLVDFLGTDAARLPSVPPPVASRLVIDLGQFVEQCVARPSAATLGRVTVLRVAPHERLILDPFEGWPTHLREHVDGGWVHALGGADLHGGQAPALRPEALDRALDLAHARGSVAICVSATGALVDQEVETRAAEYLLRQDPACKVVLAQGQGGRRFFERENAAILSAALVPGVAGLIDECEHLASATGWVVTTVGADGALVGLEDMRTSPARLIGTTTGLVAQGAADLADRADAVVLVHAGDSVRVLTIEDGMLRTRATRRSSLLKGLRFAQRHPTQSEITGPAFETLTRDIVGERHVVVTRSGYPAAMDGGAGGDSADAVPVATFEELVALVGRQLPSCTVVDELPEELAAHGARVATAQAEVLRYVVAHNETELRTAQHIVRRLAQGQVIATVPDRLELTTVEEHASPLSFLRTGPFMLRTRVVGRSVSSQELRRG